MKTPIRNRVWAAMLPALALLTACSQGNDSGPDGGQRDAVGFTTGIEAVTSSTGGGDSWTATDKVGVFMLAAGGSLAASGDVLADNVQYNATPGTPASEASFAPANAGETIYYPQSGNVDFIAYYPYGTTGTGDGQVTTGYLYNINVAGQTSEAAQNARNVLYAKTTNVAKSKTVPVNLEFGHVLSKVTLNVTLGTGFTGGDDVAAVSFSGMPGTATLDLQDGSLSAGAAGNFDALKAAAANVGADATFTALLVPQPQDGGTTSTGLPDYNSRTAVFTVDGQDYTWTIPDTEDFAAGNHYTYPVTVNKAGITVGAPTITGWNTHDNGTGTAEVLPIETVKIKAGTFQMGQTGVATPVREVTLTEDFYMSKYQVTREQYAAFLNAAGVAGVPRVLGEGQFVFHTVSGYGTQGLFLTNQWGWTPLWNDVTGLWEAVGSQPMIYVTWYGAKAYADWVGGALPTEAQWEYACRAGTTTAFYFGDDANQLGNYGWYDGNSSGIDGPSPVGTKLPNAYGLYDMHGNVQEWCSDWYAAYDSGDVTDPTGPGAGSARVLRGGSWEDYYAQGCRSASRFNYFPGGAGSSFGFRVVFVP